MSFKVSVGLDLYHFYNIVFLKNGVGAFNRKEPTLFDYHNCPNWYLNKTYRPNGARNKLYWASILFFVKCEHVVHRMALLLSIILEIFFLNSLDIILAYL